jgi:hypothetical protein
MNYEIRIGRAFDIEKNATTAFKTIKISEDQMNILILFAEKSIDKNCDLIYKIGECEFTIGINIDDTPIFGRNSKCEL